MILVTGCAHSGTKWLARSLDTLGVPCGHEVAFPWHPDEPRTPMTMSEVSWCAMPFVDEVDVPVVRLVRNPLAVARSIWRVQKFLVTDSPASRMVAMHRPDITAIDDPFARIVRYVNTWDEPVADRLTVHAEHGPRTVMRLLELVDVTRPWQDVVAACRTAPRHSHHPEREDGSIRWEDVPELIPRARALGYLP